MTENVTPEPSANNPLLANRELFVKNANWLLEMEGDDGAFVAAALTANQQLRYFGFSSSDANFSQGVERPLTTSFPGRVQLHVGDVGRTAASARFPPRERFDRVRINGAKAFGDIHRYLFEALRLTSPNALILVEKFDCRPVNEAVVSMLATGALKTADLCGWTHAPEQALVRRGDAFRDTSSVQIGYVGEERRLIVVACFGDRTRAEWAISRPSVEAYARKVDAELIEFGGELPEEHRPLAKMVALGRLPKEGRVLLLDTDIVIRRNAPDIFEIAPLKAPALFIEGQVVSRDTNMQEMLNLHKVSARKLFYGNTGVFVIPRHLVSHFALPSALPILHVDEMYEQGIFNVILHQLGYPVFNISPLFNCMPAITPEIYEDAYFVHFAGGSLGVKQNKVWTESLRPESIKLRSARSFSPKDTRVFDLRNEMRRRDGFIDVISPACNMYSETNFMIFTNGLYIIRSSQKSGLLFWGPYIALPAGHYEVEVLLSGTSLRRAFLDGLEPGAEEAFLNDVPASSPASKIGVDVTGSAGQKVHFPLAEVCVSEGAARVNFVLERGERELECHIYGNGEVLDLYGVRFRSLA